MPVPSGLCLVLTTNGTLGEDLAICKNITTVKKQFHANLLSRFWIFAWYFILFSKFLSFYLRRISRDFALDFAYQIFECIKVIKTLDTFQGNMTLIAKGLLVVAR